MPNGGYLRTCPSCKKQFGSLAFETWIYKINEPRQTLYFCGWNCMRAYEKARDAKRKEGSPWSLKKTSK